MKEGKRIHRMLVKSKTVFKDKNRKTVTKVLKELTITAFRLRCIPLHYFSYFLYRRSIENYLDYLAGKEILRIQRALHNQDTLEVLDNKLLFHEHFSKTGIAIPQRLAYNFRNIWFFDATSRMHTTEVQCADEFVTLMRNFFQHSGCTAIFAKPIYGSGGSGTMRITKGTFNPVESDDINLLFQTIVSGCFIFQDQVIQHAELSRMNPSSLNTIRIDTFRDENSDPEVISAFLRIGRTGSVIDNLMAGGLFVGIDMSSGRLHGNALSKIEKGGMICSKHPESGIEFKNFTVPYFAEVKAMARQAARLLPEKLAGWDIGVSVDGPVLIEGNGYYELAFSQMAFGGYRRHPIFRKAMKAAGLRTPV